MKNITIIIPPARFDNVKKRLVEIGVCGMTVSDVRGFGYEKKRMKLHDDREMTVELSEKVRIDIALKEEDVEQVISAVTEEARTGRLGDGKIFISELTDAVRVRTGERGEHAL
ncbi:MAG TPA: P-II family nitrogen regulator [Candidatus Goldiibacteriota bacterium]|nr:P-II family nitrogen regulator [Candidatus Goldiibacteriota bacterium]